MCWVKYFFKGGDVLENLVVKHSDKSVHESVNVAMRSGLHEYKERLGKGLVVALAFE
jgi:hypothetical protein